MFLDHWDFSWSHLNELKSATLSRCGGKACKTPYLGDWGSRIKVPWVRDQPVYDSVAALKPTSLKPCFLFVRPALFLPSALLSLGLIQHHINYSLHTPFAYYVHLLIICFSSCQESQYANLLHHTLSSDGISSREQGSYNSLILLLTPSGIGFIHRLWHVKRT